MGAIGLDVWCFALRGKTGRERHQLQLQLFWCNLDRKVECVKYGTWSDRRAAFMFTRSVAV